MLLHRWTGGVIGLLLALMGLTGAILSVENWWIRLPGAQDVGPRDSATLSRIADVAFASDHPAQSVIFAGDRFGLHEVRYGEFRGAYLNDSAQVVARWDSKWDRPELWLFDFHHHLLMGDMGETIIGLLGLIGVGFVVTGVILWWRTRKTFAFRVWPARMSRPAIVRHHRDLGVVFSPVLFLICLTGAMMIFRPVAGLVLRPLGPPSALAEMSKPPKMAVGVAQGQLDFAAMVTAAQARFPGAEIRSFALPKKPGEPITIRLKQVAEWLPNGRSMIWLDPTTSQMLASRDALSLPTNARAFNMVYPLHSGKMAPGTAGGVVWQMIVMLTGLSLAILGLFASYSFWCRGGRRAPTA